METINALTFRKKFGSILDEVYKRKKHITISRANKPLAVIIPIEDYKDQEEGKAREKRLRLAVSRIEQWRKKHAKQLQSLNSVEIIRQLRADK